MDFSDYSSSMVKLKNKQISLEKNENDLIKYIKTNCDIAAEYEWNQLKNLSDQELHKMRNDIVENFKALQNIKCFGLYENVDKLDLQTLKNTMLSFENNLQTVRDKINSELLNLSKTENALNIDIINIEIKLSDMNKKIRDVSKVPSQLPKNILEDKHIYQEVKDYTIFLTKSGGHEGGWSEDDHSAFVKMFNKYKTEKKIAVQVHRLLPDKSNEEIMAHLEWYETYLELKHKQKEAIEKWKLSKSTKEDSSEEQTTNVKCNNTSKKQPEEKQEIKEKLKHWKLEKERKCQQFLEWESQNSTRVKELEKQKRLEQLETKREVERWKSRKSVKERADQLEKEILTLRHKEKSTALTNQLIREFQSQDNLYIRRRLSKLHPGAPRVPTWNTKGSKVERDPERIFKATQQWVNRITPEDIGTSANIFAKNVSVKQIPKLAVPTWRKTAPQH